MCDGCEVNEKYYKYAILEPTKEDLLNESLCIPTQTQIRDQMGSILAEVFFENVATETRLVLGLEPPLSGPDRLWIHPTSRLKNKVRCKPIPEPEVLHKKAFTHQAIIELGQQYIDSLKLKIENEIAETFTDQKGELDDNCSKCNKRLIEALELAKIEADEHCRQVVGTLMEHFDRCFTQMVEESKLRMRKECQLRVVEERSELASYMLVQLQEEMERRNLELCSDFHDTLKGELNAQATRFIKQIDAERQVAREVLEDLVQKYETSLVELRAEMEFVSFIDICRAINEEKAKCERESGKRKGEMKEKIQSLLQCITKLNDRNKILHKMATERSNRIANYEKKMKDLIDEFQKFINFALKAVPGQAQFLLSTQKMVMKKLSEDTLLNPEDYDDIKLCLPKATAAKAPTDSLSVEKRICLPEKVKAISPKTSKNKSKEETASKYTFNYFTFKYNLLKKFVKDLKFEGDKYIERNPHLSRKNMEKIQEEEEDGLSEGTRAVVKEYKEGLILEGEQAKEHLKPVETFLQDRMKTLIEMCKDDPDMVRLLLDCPKKSRY